LTAKRTFREDADSQGFLSGHAAWSVTKLSAPGGVRLKVSIGECTTKKKSLILYSVMIVDVYSAIDPWAIHIASHQLPCGSSRSVIDDTIRMTHRREADSLFFLRALGMFHTFTEILLSGSASYWREYTK
jgi:hypothetical protein